MTSPVAPTFPGRFKRPLAPTFPTAPTFPPTNALPTPPIPIGAGGAWYRSTETGGVSSGSLALWPDISGNGNDATQATMASQPTVTANQINGLPGVVGDGVEDLITTTNTTLSLGPTPFSAVFVFNRLSGVGYACLFGKGNNSGGSGRLFISPSGNFLFSWGDDTQTYTISTINITQGVFSVCAVSLSSGGVLTFSVNGVVETHLVTLSGTDIALPVTIFSDALGAGDGYFINADLPELLIVPYAATDTQRQTFDNYAFARYAGLTDPDAQNFVQAQIAAGVSLSLSQMQAINNLVVDGKANGWWSSMEALYPFLGVSAACDSLNLVNPAAFQITWSGTVTHDSTGITGDGLTGFGDTGFSSFSSGVCGAAYIRNPSTGVGFDPVFYAGNAGTDGVGIFSNTTADRQLLYGGVGFDNTFGVQDGFLAFNGGASGTPCYFNGALVGTQSGAIITPSTNFALLRSIGFTAFGSANIALAAIMNPATMTGALQAAFYADVQTFQTALGRQI